MLCIDMCVVARLLLMTFWGSKAYCMSPSCGRFYNGEGEGVGWGSIGSTLWVTRVNLPPEDKKVCTYVSVYVS